MKLPNGYGSIVKLSGKRREPFAIVITLGWDENGKQIRKYVGYAKNRKEGLEKLSAYHGNPYDLDYKNLTFNDLWLEVLEDIKNLINDDKMSLSNLKGLSSTYKNHLKSLYNIKIMDLKYKKVQDVIDDIELGYTTKGYAKTIVKKVLDKAINEYELPINDFSDRLKVGSKKKSDMHKPFTKEEIKLLWKHKNNNLVKMLLIMIYGGERPTEIFITERDNIHLNENYIITGIKTENGKNRIIPIHPDIKPIFEEFYATEYKYPFQSIFEQYNYQKYTRENIKLMKELKLDHTPYDCRHTFATRMKELNANEYILKRIMGHSINDITENTYTHRSINQLYEEIKKLNYD